MKFCSTQAILGLFEGGIAVPFSVQCTAAVACIFTENGEIQVLGACYLITVLASEASASTRFSLGVRFEAQY